MSKFAKRCTYVPNYKPWLNKSFAYKNTERGAYECKI